MLKDPSVFYIWEWEYTSYFKRFVWWICIQIQFSVFRVRSYFKGDTVSRCVRGVNPIGSAKKKHKMLGVYFTLANFHSFHRSTVDNLQLLLLYREADFKYFGHEKVFSPLPSDLRELETNGLNIHRNIVKATVCCIAGGSLGSHNIGGFTENFCTSCYFCRYCHVTRSEQDNLEYHAPIRTIQDYNDTVQELQNDDASEVRGLKFDSPAFFNVCQPGLPPCIGHDLFEWHTNLQLAIYLNYFVKVKKFLCLHFQYLQPNRRIRQFSYQRSDVILHSQTFLKRM